MAEKIIYPWRNLAGGLFTATDNTEMPPSCLQEGSQNMVWDKGVSYKTLDKRPKNGGKTLHRR